MLDIARRTTLRAEVLWVSAILLVYVSVFAILLAPPAFAQARIALVIGNGDYADQPRLPNPANDADDMAAALQALGFKVIEGMNLNKTAFDAKLHDFARSTSGADVALFFYSGHGMQINGVNYLIPIDAPATKEDLLFQTVTLDFIQSILESAKTKIIMLDACRNNPFAAALAQSMGTRAVTASSGLAVATAPDLGYFIAYSTQPGHVASDGSGRNSPFTASLKSHLSTPGLSISDLMITVRNDVVQATNAQQIPWDHSALASRFFFREGQASDPGEGGRKLSDAAEAWGWVRDTSNPASLQHFLSLYGDTPFAVEAQTRLASLGPGASATRGTIAASAADVRPGASKPSFECRARHTDAEVTVCNRPELSALDNELDRVYTQTLRSLSGPKVMALVQDQRSWVSNRNGCGTDVACLTGQYAAQIQKLKSSYKAAPPQPEIAPSFDCSSRTHPAEVSVCRQPELAQLDLNVDQLYTQKLKTVLGAGRKELVEAQRAWLRNRDECSGSVACLKVQYKARIEQLQ